MNIEVNKKGSILFLHGYTQNSLVLQKRLKVLTKAINKEYPDKELLFPDAPFILEKYDNSIDPELIKRGWMYLYEEDKFKSDNFAQMEEAFYFGFIHSMKEILNLIENKRIECVISFSQGSLLFLFILIILIKSKKEDLTDLSFKKYFPHLKCVILIAGFIKPVPLNEELSFFKNVLEEINKNGNIKSDEDKIDLPSLHIWGALDEYIEPKRSENVSKLFLNSETYEHKGKHFIPTSKDDLEIYLGFLNKYLKN
jgi:hypothetical protein